MKRLITSMLIVLLISVAFIGSFYKGYYSYAEDINYMSDAELEAAYQAYLQSKGGGFLGNAGARLAYTNGKMLNFLTSEYNTTPFKNINEVKGLLSWEKAELESGNSSVLQLTMRHPEVFSLYTQWLLQNHYFGNGVTDSDGMFDDGIDNTLYSGDLYTDQSGNKSLVYYINSSNSNGSSTNSSESSTLILKYGSSYCYTKSDYSNANNVTVPFNNGTYTIPIIHNTSTYYFNGSYYDTASDSNCYQIDTLNTNNTSNWNSVTKSNGDIAILHLTNNNYYVGWVAYYTYKLNDGRYFSIAGFKTYSRLTDNSNIENNVDINFYTNVNNNITNYPDINADGTLYITPKVKINGEYKPYIVNQGDSITNVVNNYYNDSGEKDNTITEPSDQPSGSGGGSGGSGGSGGTPPNWSNPYPNLSPDGNGGFNFNFNLPDLNIDWNISGLSEKFPFSIPFDLIRFITVLNAEPETPHFEGTVNLIVYQWDIDADLSQFDNLASIVRNVEFIGFCITLILITRKMIKG